jgi:Anti-sigma-K factor rskA/Sigma-70, region 4
MATFDQLSAEQRAIVELVLQQGKSYEELAAMLAMPETRVRELARDALVDLAPVTAGGVEEDWRGQLADYVLGQQAGPEATATRGHLRRSEPARAWARSLLDSLDQLYRNGSMPAIPDGERRRRGRTPRAAAAPADRSTAGREPAPDAAVKRRRLLAVLGAAAALVLVAVLVWPVGVLTGGDDNGGEPQAAGSPAGGRPEVSAQTRGQAIIARQTDRPQIIVTATGLPPSTERSAYQVWLYNSREDRKSVGAQVTDARGNLQAGGPLPTDYRRYRFIDVTEVAVTGDSFRTGQSVLRGGLRLRERPITRGTGKNSITLLADIQLAPPPGGTR